MLQLIPHGAFIFANLHLSAFLRFILTNTYFTISTLCFSPPCAESPQLFPERNYAPTRIRCIRSRCIFNANNGRRRRDKGIHTWLLFLTVPSFLAIVIISSHFLPATRKMKSKELQEYAMSNSHWQITVEVGVAQPRNPSNFAVPARPSDQPHQLWIDFVEVHFAISIIDH